MSGVTRWTPGRKEEVVAAIRRGELTRERALELHELSADELATWEARFAAHGRPGLSVRGLQELAR